MRRKMKIVYMTIMTAICFIVGLCVQNIKADAIDTSEIRDDLSIKEYSSRIWLDYITPEYEMFILERDSEVVFDASFASFWGLDQVVHSSGADAIYLREPTEFQLNKGKHYMYLLQTNGDDYVDLKYKVYPRCNVYEVSDGQTIKISSYYMTETEEKLKLPNYTKMGDKVEGWYEDRSFTIPVEKIDKSIGKDWVLYPKMYVKDKTLQYVLNGGENSENNPTRYSLNDGEIKLEAPMKEGSRFLGWYTDSNYKKKIEKLSSELYRTSDNEKITLYAKWEKISYKIIYKNIIYKDNCNNPEEYYEDDQVIYLEDAERIYNPEKDLIKYEFVGWYSEPEFINKVESINPSDAKDVTLYAKWQEEIIPFAVFDKKKITIMVGQYKDIELDRSMPEYIGLSPALKKMDWSVVEPGIIKLLKKSREGIRCEATGIGKTKLLLNVDDAYTTECEITVIKPQFKSKKLSIKAGKCKIVKFVNDANMNKKGFKFDSSNEKIVRVNAHGKLMGMSKGTSIITATHKKSGITCKCCVVVK